MGIIEKKEENPLQETLLEEENVVVSSPIYTETEFWVAGAFCLFVAVMFVPVTRIIKALLQKKINIVKKSISDATETYEEAQKLLAKYARQLGAAKHEADEIMQGEEQRIAALKQEKLAQLEHLTQSKVRTVEQKIKGATDNVYEEIKGLICRLSLQKVEEICREKLSPEMHDKLIENSISRLKKL